MGNRGEIKGGYRRVRTQTGGLGTIWQALALLSTIPMVYGGAAVLSVLMNWKREVWERPEPKYGKRVTVVVPLYKEKERDVAKTFDSISKQRYPRELVEVIVVVESDDYNTKEVVKKEMWRIKFEKRVVEVSGRQGKWKALNAAISVAKGDVIVIYDAGDDVEEDHLALACAMTDKYDVITSKVIRIGPGLLGQLYAIDTKLWYDVMVPAIKKLTGYVPLSGEGLTIKKGITFADCLAEDAYLLVESCKRGLRVGALDSTIREGAPGKITSMIKQRSRWYRGYLECLVESLRECKGLKALKLALAFSLPISSVVVSIDFVVAMLSPLIRPPAYVSAITYVNTAMLFMAPIYLMKDFDKKALIVAPLHWLFQGIITIYSMFKNEWYKTERSYAD